MMTITSMILARMAIVRSSFVIYGYGAVFGFAAAVDTLAETVGALGLVAGT